jgi:putative colanic acid biosynthesis glycosyltransferase
MADSPLISVIVVCKNPGPSLYEALTSVWAQRHIVPELVVVDGASTDGSRDWLETHRSRLAAFRSEPDAGVYDAMNKGIATATGKWVLFLGADDRLASDTVLGQATGLLAITQARVATGEAAYDNGRVYRMDPQPNPVARNFVHHQATFYRRELFTQHGSFDRALAIMGDYDLNARLWKNKVEFTALPLRVANCRSGGLSDAGGWRGYREEITVRHRYFPLVRCLVWDIGSIVRFLRKKMLLNGTPPRPA